jgi:Membrane bound O-acyl transferase family
MRYALILPLLTATQIVVGLLVTGGKTRRACSVLIATIGLGVPLLLPMDVPWVRALSSLTAIMTLLRTIDLVRENKPRSALFRIVHVALPMDTRRFTSVRPSFSLREFAAILAFTAVAVPSLLVVIYVAPQHTGASRFLIRWGIGLIFVYTLSDAAYRFATLLFLALGYEAYALHPAPILAVTVKEFWGERWNRTVSAWFFEHILRPFARARMPRVGVFMSFVASGVLHGYLVATVASFAMVGVMFLYFVAQGVLVLLEMRFHATTWHRTVARGWTLGLMICGSPLFVEPGLQWMGI